MTSTQFLLLTLIVVLSWFAWEYKRHQSKKNKEKMQEFMGFYELGIKMIRDEADRDNFTDAKNCHSYLIYAQKWSFCKKTERLINELWDLWRSKFAHLYKTNW